MLQGSLTPKGRCGPFFATSEENETKCDTEYEMNSRLVFLIIVSNLDISAAAQLKDGVAILKQNVCVKSVNIISGIKVKIHQILHKLNFNIS